MGRLKASLEEVKAHYAANGSTFLDDVYLSKLHKHRCTCSFHSCPNRGTDKAVVTNFFRQKFYTKLGNKPLCADCSVLRKREFYDGRRVPREVMEARLLEKGIILLDYVMQAKPMTCKCVGDGCDRPIQIRHHHIEAGTLPRCPEHLAEFWKGKTGPNHHCHDPSITDEERLSRKRGGRMSGIDRWYSDILKAADYTCALTGQRGGKLSAHHLYSVTEYPELALDPRNGICISEEIHRQFHSWLLTTHKTRRCTQHHFREFRSLFYPS